MNITTAFETVKWKARRLGWNVAETSMTIYVAQERISPILPLSLSGELTMKTQDDTIIL